MSHMIPPADLIGWVSVKAAVVADRPFPAWTFPHLGVDGPMGLVVCLCDGGILHPIVTWEHSSGGRYFRMEKQQ